MGHIRGLTKNRRELFHEFDNMHEDLGDLRKDLTVLKEALLKFGKSGMSGASSRVKAKIQKRVDELSEHLGTARERGRESIQALQQQVEQRPLISLGIALGAGFILSKLISLR